MSDLISRQAAIEAIQNEVEPFVMVEPGTTCVIGAGVNDADVIRVLEQLPSAQPTLYGYNIKHLELIARVLQKEDLSPERVVEALTDIGRIVAIVTDEFEESLRKAVEQCKI